MNIILGLVIAALVQWNSDKLPLGLYVAGLIFAGMVLVGGHE